MKGLFAKGEGLSTYGCSEEHQRVFLLLILQVDDGRKILGMGVFMLRAPLCAAGATLCSCVLFSIFTRRFPFALQADEARTRQLGPLINIGMMSSSRLGNGM